MKLENLFPWVAVIAGIAGLITFVDEYFLRSTLLTNLSIPESIHTSIFLITLCVLAVIMVFSSPRKLALPYPDQRKIVDTLKQKLDKCEEIEQENKALKRQLAELSTHTNNEEALMTRIHGILSRGSKNMPSLIRELGIDHNDSITLNSVQLAIGKLTKNGIVNADSLGYYKLANNT